MPVIDKTMEDGAGPRALTPREVFLACVKVLASSETALIGADAHLVRFLADEKIENEDDVDFITDVFLGCVRFSKMIDVIVEGFLAREGRNFLQKDIPMLRVVCYVAVVVVGSTGVEVLDMMLSSLPRSTIAKLAPFLRFGWVGDAMSTWIRQGWCAVFDAAYVEEQLLGPLALQRGAIADLCDRLDARLSSHAASPKRTSKPTVPRPFRLSQQPVRASVKSTTTERPAATRKIQPVAVPKTTYSTPIELQALERKRRANRERAEQNLQASELEVSPRLVAAGESERTRRLREEIQAREEAEMRVRIKAKPVPTVVNADVPVRLNAGAILREERLARVEAEAEARRLAAVEAGGFDEIAFAELEAARAAAAAAEDESDVRVKHLKGLIAREDAALAMERLDEKNKRAARRMRVGREELRKAIQEERRAVEEQNRRVVMDTAQLQERVAKAKAALVEQKAEVVRDVTEASNALLNAAAEREAAERERQAEIIREIRALEIVPSSRNNPSSSTFKCETSGFGFLNEMSYVELQERLAMLRVRAKSEEDARREAIVRERAESERALAEKLATVEQARAARQAAAQTARRKVSSHTVAATGSSQSTDPRVAELEAQLEAKRTAVLAKKNRRVSQLT